MPIADWSPDSRPGEGTFNLRVGEAGSVREMAQQTRTLAAYLQQWQQRAPWPKAVPAPLATLGAPQIGAVTGTSPRSAGKARSVIRTLFFLALIAWGVNLLFGLPLLGVTTPLVYSLILLAGSASPAVRQQSLWHSLPAAPGWYVIAVSWLVFLVHLIPHWRYRDPVVR